MSRVDGEKSLENPANAAGVESGVYLYSPHPEIKIAIISTSHPPGDRPVGIETLRIAERTARALGLDPARVVWIERARGETGSLSRAIFHALDFDWWDGLAVRVRRSPLHEDWHLSWLEPAR